MKKISLVFAIFSLVAFFVFSAFASGREFEITVPKGFSYAYEDESKSDVAKKLGMTNTEVNDFFKENNVEFLAINDDKLSQIRVSVYEDDFSRQTENLSVYSDKDIKKLAKQIVKDTSLSYDVYQRNSRKYIRITESLNDSGGNFTATQFITVADGKMYNISFCNSGKKFNEDNLDVLDTFTLNNQVEESTTSILVLIAIAIGVAGFATIIALMVLGIVKENQFKEKKKED